MNTEVSIPNGLSDIDKLIYLVRVSDKADQLTREGLYKVFSEKSWEGRFGSWDEFVTSPDGLNKSAGWASKHLKIYTIYTLEGGVSQDKLLGIPTESLYLARDLDGSIEEKVEKARTLTRQELKISHGEDKPHEAEYIEVCKHCWLTRETHP